MRYVHSPLRLSAPRLLRAHLRPPPSRRRRPACAAPPAPDYTLTANVGLFSQYIFRGIAQTAGKPAVQGGFDWAHSSGFYLGTWGSNISWLEDFGAVHALQPRVGFLRRLQEQLPRQRRLDLRRRHALLLLPGQPQSRLRQRQHLGTLRRAQLEVARREGRRTASTTTSARNRPARRRTARWYVDLYANYPVGETGFTLLGHYGILNVAPRRQRQQQGLVQRLEDRRLVRGAGRPAEGLRNRRVLQRQRRQARPSTPTSPATTPRRTPASSTSRRRSEPRAAIRRQPPTRGDIMKLVTAIIKPFKLDEVREALSANRRAGRHRHRGQGLRPAEGAHGALSRRGIRRRLSAEGEDRSRDQERAARPRDRSDREGRENRQDRRRQDLRLRSRTGRAHPHRGNRRGRALRGTK